MPSLREYDNRGPDSRSGERHWSPAPLLETVSLLAEGRGHGTSAGGLTGLTVTVRSSPPRNQPPRAPPSTGTPQPVELPKQWAGPCRGVLLVSFWPSPDDQMSIAASEVEPAILDVDPGMMAMLEWKLPPCSESSRLDDWYLGWPPAFTPAPLPHPSAMWHRGAGRRQVAQPILAPVKPGSKQNSKREGECASPSHGGGPGRESFVVEFVTLLAKDAIRPAFSSQYEGGVLQPLLHSTQERRWVMTDLGPAHLEPGPSQAIVQDAHTEAHLQVCPSPEVCSDRPKGCVLSCFGQASCFPGNRPFLRFAFKGQTCQCLVLPFGLSPSPCVSMEVKSSQVTFIYITLLTIQNCDKVAVQY
ncbi:hypothetical protein M9458_056982 [Cirrhinus mrigala]|uniref:Uncharacterized protein n=1 Tax=Cirrhinus mrigala TaxID=683832 RepID=A0ABD0MC11_CIRMR